ncbi:helix-turn-helix transcriptional regulator [Methylocystis parvus]|uniref:Helix-turn-helix domain-containing protein n=1 Tax=Methylocystis parvus TaxID=134 RepID=A0A6B8M8A8_9HYPH|nr:helix-turn-helix transcriptional regulator [Methylocystis parvus]QGM98122.1 helix-turn-helix domain-containing protein [Methylocystis parvus]WBK01556.1 helix-turn-helix transcriptional regulator [Methylocystis parvus OBBP]
MSEYFTTKELASLLRVKERKVYDLVSSKALPVRRVTGKLLFPKEEIQSWIAASGAAAQAPAPAQESAQTPLVMAGGHDPLLEWALRESRSGIAALLDGALDGLARFRDGGCLAAGLHIPEKNAADWNVGAVKREFGREPVVLIEWVKRTRGLIYKPSSRKVERLADIGELRFQSRQPEAGSELVLGALLAKEGLRKSDLQSVDSVERTETDLAIAISNGHADVGLGIEAMARQFGLAFSPLLVERFDLLIWRKAYFDPPFQAFMSFCASAPFRSRAESLGGYDVGRLGSVHFNGP